MNNGLSVHLVWGWGLRDRSLLGPEFFYVIFNIVDFIYHIHYDIFWVWGLDHLRPWWDLQHCQWMPLLSCPWKRKLEGIKLKNRCHFCVRKFWYPYSKQNHLSPSLTTFLYPTISLANFHSCKSTSITNINHYHPLTSLCVVSLLSHNNTTNTNANIMIATTLTSDISISLYGETPAVSVLKLLPWMWVSVWLPGERRMVIMAKVVIKAKV